jgi:hypothetical protein
LVSPRDIAPILSTFLIRLRFGRFSDDPPKEDFILLCNYSGRSFLPLKIYRGFRRICGFCGYYVLEKKQHHEFFLPCNPLFPCLPREWARGKHRGPWKYILPSFSANDPLPFFHFLYVHGLKVLPSLGTGCLRKGKFLFRMMIGRFELGMVWQFH